MQNDPQQAQVVMAFDRLQAELLAPRRIGLRRSPAPRGIYLHGGVGRGKSMLMDLFYDSLPDDFPKRRVHFHAFMIEVQQALNTARLEDRAERGLPDLAAALARDLKLLCFDEFHVTDVADAMILGRLFTALFDRGLAVVATSNWPPDRLYEGGLQRDRFKPFIALVKDRMQVIAMTGGHDYRAAMLSEGATYFYPLDAHARARADALFARLADHAIMHEDVLQVRGHRVMVQRAAGPVAGFTFAQLCENALGAEDYLAIADRYTTVFLDGVPKLTYDRRNETKRLMILVDTLYDRRRNLVVTADAAAEHLYRGGDYAFEFQRTVSRLLEMQSAGYLTR